MAPSDFSTILIHGYPAALPNNRPLLTPSYKPCAVCEVPTLRKCAKCSGPSYCCVQHENAHWNVHRRTCTGAPIERQDHAVKERRAMIRPLRCYEVGANEELPMVKSLHFNPYKEHFQEVNVRYRPAGRRLNDQFMGPCPVLGSYFPNDVPQCVLLESYGGRTLDQPLAIWYSKKSLQSRRLPNMAILSLLDPHSQPRSLWYGPVVVTKFASWSYLDFVSVTSDDLTCLKLYFSNYVGIQEIR